MDRYAVQMIARGPTLAGDGDAPTGSVHIVDLPDSDGYASIEVHSWQFGGRPS